MNYSTKPGENNVLLSPFLPNNELQIHNAILFDENIRVLISFYDPEYSNI